MKISTISTIVLFLVALLGSIGGTSYYYIQCNQAMTEQVYSHLESVAQSRGSHINTLLENFKGETKMISTGNVFREIADESIDYDKRIVSLNKRINLIIASNEDIERIRALDKNGKIIASSHDEEGLDKSNSDIFLNGKEGIYIEELHVSNFTGNFVLSIAHPIFLENEFAGVLIVNFHNQKLNEIVLDKTGLSETGETYLVNDEGYAISPLLFVEGAILEWKVDSINSRNCFLHEHEPEIGCQEHGAVQIFLNYRGEKVIGVHIYIPEMKWCLLAEISEEEVLGVQRALFQKVSLIVIIVLVVVITFVGFFVGRFVDKRVVLKKGKKGL